MNRSKEDASRRYERVKILGKTVLFPNPVPLPETRLVGRDDIIEKALAAWTPSCGRAPLHFRLYGPPGVGKNALIYEMARLLEKDLYIINGHDELGPEDIACTATVTDDNKIEYVASPLFAGAYRGGIVFFDEIGKAPSSALDPLASLLDDRRRLSSVLAGIHIKAHEGFLFCAALNDIEEEGVGLKDFLDERTRPAILVDYPSIHDMKNIIKRHFPEVSELWTKVFIKEFKDSGLSPRKAITLMGYANRLYRLRNNGSDKANTQGIRECFKYLKDDMGLGKSKDESCMEEPNKTSMEEEVDEYEFDYNPFGGNKGPIH